MAERLEDVRPTAGEKKSLATMRPKEQIAYLLAKKKDEIAAMLPKHLNAERLLKVAQIAATTTPALLKCDVPSLIGAIAQCAQMGLEPNTVLGHAYLVPFNTKRKDPDGSERWVNSVQVIIGYKGLIDLARRSGQIISIAAHEVRRNDKFELRYGLNEKLDHVPAMGERGDLTGFYAVAMLKDGGHAMEFMSLEQVEAVRDGSQGWQQAVKWKKQAAHPWSAHFVEMGRKTVIRRLAKYLPLSIEFQLAASLDELAAAGKDQGLSIDGEFMPVSGAEDGAEDFSGAEDAAPAIEDGRAEQAMRQAPPQQQAEIEGRAVEGRAGAPVKTEAATEAPDME